MISPTKVVKKQPDHPTKVMKKESSKPDRDNQTEPDQQAPCPIWVVVDLQSDGLGCVGGPSNNFTTRLISHLANSATFFSLKQITTFNVQGIFVLLSNLLYREHLAWSVNTSLILCKQYTDLGVVSRTCTDVAIGFATFFDSFGRTDALTDVVRSFRGTVFNFKYTLYISRRTASLNPS